MNTRRDYNVPIPALFRFDPNPGTANGNAVIIVLSGAFYVLMVDKSATIAKELANKGLTVFLLKYRLLI